MNGVTGREAMEPIEYSAVRRPRVEPFGSSKKSVHVSRIRRLFSRDLSCVSGMSIYNGAVKDYLPIVTCSCGSNADDEGPEVELPQSGFLCPLDTSQMRCLSLGNLDVGGLLDSLLEHGELICNTSIEKGGMRGMAIQKPAGRRQDIKLKTQKD